MASSILPTSDNAPVRNVRILGAGKFGEIAARRLSTRYTEANFLIVDLNEEKLARLQRDLGLPIHMEDAVSFLGWDSLPEDTWIIPAVPIHVAFRWILHQLKKTESACQLPVPEAADAQVPNPLRTKDGTLYTSFATFICPDNCSEPDEICSHTRKPRPGNLFEFLSRIRIAEFQIAVVRSRQLAPGVGGYTVGHLNEAWSRISGKAGAYLVATSCRCHGVVNALRWIRDNAEAR